MVVDVGAVLISAIMAGAVAIAATLVIERWGGALGSLVAIPTTIVPAAIGIWHGSSSVEAHANAMSMVPIGMLLNILFLGAWRILLDRTSLVRWFTCHLGLNSICGSMASCSRDINNNCLNYSYFDSATLDWYFRHLAGFQYRPSRA